MNFGGGGGGGYPQRQPGMLVPGSAQHAAAFHAKGPDNQIKIFVGGLAFQTQGMFDFVIFVSLLIIDLSELNKIIFYTYILFFQRLILLSTLRNLVELMMLSSCVISRPIEVEALVLLKSNLKTNRKRKTVRTKLFP